MTVREILDFSAYCQGIGSGSGRWCSACVENFNCSAPGKSRTIISHKKPSEGQPHFDSSNTPAACWKWRVYHYSQRVLIIAALGMLLVALTPNIQVASILASFCYNIMNLFSGFLIPQPNIPKWWIWFYWICPAAWSLKGFITSQYGDIEKEIIVFGEQKAINAFLQSYYGYHHHLLGVIASVLVAVPLVFATGFAYAIAKLNFQRR